MGNTRLGRGKMSRDDLRDLGAKDSGKKRTYRLMDKSCARCSTAFKAAHQRKYCDACVPLRREEKLKSWRDGATIAFRCKAMGISVQDYQETLARQANLCAICKVALNRERGGGSGNSRAPHMDHDHITGEFRGILCGNCNRGLGQLGDSIESVRNALVYLETSWRTRTCSPSS